MHHRLRAAGPLWPARHRGTVLDGSASAAGARLGLQSRWCSARAAARRVRFPCASVWFPSKKWRTRSRRILFVIAVPLDTW